MNLPFFSGRPELWEEAFYHKSSSRTSPDQVEDLSHIVNLSGSKLEETMPCCGLGLMEWRRTGSQNRLYRSESHLAKFAPYWLLKRIGHRRAVVQGRQTRFDLVPAVLSCLPKPCDLIAIVRDSLKPWKNFEMAEVTMPNSAVDGDHFLREDDQGWSQGSSHSSISIISTGETPCAPKALCNDLETIGWWRLVQVTG